MMYTQRHYKDIASAIDWTSKLYDADSQYANGAIDALRVLRNVMANRFEQDNERFKRELFVKASGV